jgi:hypothetical protein
MTKLRAVFAIACTFLLASCLPVTSKTPVGTTVGLGADKALVGTWTGRSEDQPGNGQKDKGTLYLHFLPEKSQDTPALVVVWVFTGSAKNNGEVDLYELRTAKLGDNNFIDVLKLGDIDHGLHADDSKDNGLNGGSVPVLYKFGKHHTLTLYMLDEDKVKAAIAKGEIAGTVEPGDYGDVQLTNDAKTLDAFMARPEAAKLFKVFLVLRKTE